MLTRPIRIQLVIFTMVTVLAIVILGWYYLRVPRLVGIGQYTLYADLPASGGLYKTSNVTYRGIQIGKVTAVAPTESGVRATGSMDAGHDENRRAVQDSGGCVGECAFGVGGR